MKRTTITMPDDLALLVEREAARRRTSVSEVVRVSLNKTLRGEERRRVPWAGIVREPKLTYGADLDAALADEWEEGMAGGAPDGDR